MGISLRIDNDDIPLIQMIETDRQYQEIDRLQSMSGVFGYDGRKSIEYKSDFDLIG